MGIGKRDYKKIAKAVFAKKHYIAFAKMWLICRNPFDSFIRYIFGTGHYPAKISLRTPLGKIDPEIYSYYDILTINEIFCRTDYKTGKDIKVVVDIGSNIGISALYFLTRNDHAKCYLFEPDPDNVRKLAANLQKFEDRYILKECAIARESGKRQFGQDPFGRYGGLNRHTGNYINVECLNINGVLQEILKTEGRIDILKMDIEGDEIDVLRWLDRKILDKINNIFFEIDRSYRLDRDFSFYPEIFRHRRYGETFKLINKNTYDK